MKVILILLLLFCSCDSESPPSAKEVTIEGRLFRFPVYKAKVPLTWEEIKREEDRADTKKPIAQFKVPNGVNVVVHNFPVEELKNRIPPEAQIERWKNQAHSTDFELAPFTRGGFGGFRLEVFEEKAMIAYAMQLNSLLFQSMQTPKSAIEDGFFKEMRADYTIKATGSKEALAEVKEEIDHFAKSFQWIHPIRMPR